MRRATRVSITAVTALLLATALTPAQALLINLDFAVPGNTRSVILGGRPFQSPGSTTGSGSFEAVFTAAAAMWESVLHDDRTFNITIGWGDLGNRTVAAAAPGGALVNEIVVSKQLRPFLDPTPFQNEEFAGFTELNRDLGGGVINVARGYTSASGLGGGIDLLATALHEIGHVLGNAFDRLGFGSTLLIDDGPFAGTMLPCAQDSGLCGHLSFSLGGALMDSFGALPPFQRALIGGADLLFVASDGGFVDIDTSLIGQVPEPPAVALLALLLLAGTRRRA